MVRGIFVFPDMIFGTIEKIKLQTLYITWSGKIHARLILLIPPYPVISATYTRTLIYGPTRKIQKENHIHYQMACYMK